MGQSYDFFHYQRRNPKRYGWMSTRIRWNYDIKNNKLYTYITKHITHLVHAIAWGWFERRHFLEMFHQSKSYTSDVRLWLTRMFSYRYATNRLHCLTVKEIHGASFVRSTRYNDVIMGAIASEITSFTIVYSIVYSDADQWKNQSSASLAFVPGEFPAQMASYAENVAIWWHHHALAQIPPFSLQCVCYIKLYQTNYITVFRRMFAALLPQTGHTELSCR